MWHETYYTHMDCGSEDCIYYYLINEAYNQSAGKKSNFQALLQNTHEYVITPFNIPQMNQDTGT